jgi:hypothetical protein
MKNILKDAKDYFGNGAKLESSDIFDGKTKKYEYCTRLLPA